VLLLGRKSFLSAEFLVYACIYGIQALTNRKAKKTFGVMPAYLVSFHHHMHVCIGKRVFAFI